MVANATFNNISAISWWSVLFVEENGVPGENHRSAAIQWHTLSYTMTHLYNDTLYHIQWHTLSYIVDTSKLAGLIRYMYYRNLLLLNKLIILKTKVLLPQAYVTLADYYYPV